MDFILERTRSGQEELEYLEKATSALLRDREVTQGPKRVSIETAIKNLVDEAQSVANDLINIYRDQDGLRRDEIRRISGAGESGSDQDALWTCYYSSLKQLKDFYRQNEHLNVALEPRTAEQMANKALSRIDLHAIFTPEEQQGRCLDLLENFRSFVNLQELRAYRERSHRQQEVLRLQKRGVKDPKEREAKMAPYVELDYATYLGSLDKFHLIPRHCKYRVDDYRNYLDSLQGYFADFFQRQNPLVNVQQLLNQFESEFADAWDAGKIEHWKEATNAMDFYLKPVDRLFASEGVFKSFQQGKRYQRAVQQFSQFDSTELDNHTQSSRDHDRELAKLEFLAQNWVKVLESTIEKTIENLHKRESRTNRELEASQSLALQILEAVENTQVNSGDESEEEDAKPVYNPLNLPLGYDGKPIPFWLYKLHGLGVEFKCEICGNYSYWGRKAFENHFSEWRHCFGMRCLGIPNTPHFREITTIQDAFALYERLRNHPDNVGFNVAQEVECEDNEGNVMSVRAYEDLRRQGLL
ncbi:bifunctional SF3A3 domain/Splicing factor 3A subunit 3/Splicing factor SF3a60 -Prp9 subunit [Babesia duncani]|uniref:Bifunctional SF3A3 domain/Splicing factor 3A subunit 3/Splicing factor SF3a60 -Prp9 subunit n=1 Tax=Babesia duncani TaxID=323732 RepID=A0AAD9UQ38_9APIC|nr:bifunctional SF3A3 domain/Splicing factor 3A subunit 3/Splicing factor SF3a60 -Prp9 subunit [Babesia duncani]